MAFFDLSFPRDVAAGVSGGPERRVNMASLGSGFEERNARWRHSRRSYQAGLGIRTADDLAEVLALFEEMGGPLHSFRFRDGDGAAFGFTDHDEPLTFGDLTYEARAALAGSDLGQSLGLAVDDQDVSGALTSDRITPRDLIRGSTMARAS